MDEKTPPNSEKVFSFNDEDCPKRAHFYEANGHVDILSSGKSSISESVEAHDEETQVLVSDMTSKEPAEYLFKFIVLTQIFLYLEAGAIPCLLDQMTAAANLSAQEQGALGGVVYLTLSAASPLCGLLLKRYNVKYILGISIVANNFFMLGFALTPTNSAWSPYLLIFARGLVGFTQAFVCVYSPLWVDVFAPRKKVAGWMSYLQGAVPLGVMFGYFLGAVLVWFMQSSGPDSDSNNVSNNECIVFSCWRWPFIIQCILVTPIMIGVFFIPLEHLDATTTKKNYAKRKVDDKAAVIGFVEEDLSTRHPHVVLERDHSLRWSTIHERDYVFDSTSSLLSSEQNSLLPNSVEYNEEDELNLSQKSAMRASYIQPRVRLDSYDVVDTYADQSGSPVKTALSDLSDVSLLYGSSKITDVSLVASEVEDNSVGEIPKSFSYRRSSRVSTCGSQLDHNEDIMVYYEEDTSILQSILILLRIPIFVLVVLGLTSIYFVVTGVQYWSTIFMIKSLHASRFVVNVLFVVIAGTGPIFGVFFGGWIIDLKGGYHGVINRARALGICVCLGLIAFMIAIVTTFFNDIYITAFFLWLLLFFGGSVLPACTGIFISVTPKQHRALASSLSVMVFNLLGYSLSPYLTGLAMNFILSHRGVTDSYFVDCDEACAYRLGFRFCLSCCLWSLLFISMAWGISMQDAHAFQRGSGHRLAEKKSLHHNYG